MEFLNKKNIIPSLFAAICTIAGCTQNTSSITAERSSLSFEITAATTDIIAPQELVITISNGLGFNRERSIPNPSNTGSVQFPEVPYGHLFVDVQGMSNGFRTMFGHSEAEISAPKFNTGVVLRNNLSTKTIGPVKEQLFLQSAFWDDTYGDNRTVQCWTASSSTTLLTTVVASQQYLYFLFQVQDHTFTGEDRPVNQNGEMTADAVIVYLCKSPPYELNANGGVFPAVRFQCEVGKDIVDNCEFNFVNFQNSAVRNFTMAALNNDEVKGRMVRSDAQCTLELRINKGLLELPTDNTNNRQLFGLVIRYRDSIDPFQPVQLFDWQSGQVESDPKTQLTSWGYLDIAP